ncbi:MAG TPA: hypothetical protein VGH80_07690 [Xanthomonadaceae bacterium]|jgi:hypothetical protein
MHLVTMSRLPALRRFWLTGLAAAMLVSSTLALAAKPDHGSEHKSPTHKHEKAAGHEEKASDHADKKEKHDKAEGHGKKGSDGGSLLKVLEKAAKSKSDSQNAP